MASCSDWESGFYSVDSSLLAFVGMSVTAMSEPTTFDAFCDREFPQWRFSVDSQTVDAVRWMRQTWDAAVASQQARIRELFDEAADAESERDNLAAQLADARAEIVTWQRTCGAHIGEIAKQEVEIERLKKAEFNLREELTRLYDDDAKLLAVVEAAREWLEDWREPAKRGGQINLNGEPPAAEQLRAALAALEEKPADPRRKG